MSIYQKVAPKQNLTKFLKDMKDRNITPKSVEPHWPYDYEGIQAFEIEYNNKTFYFSFGSEGQLLQKKVF